MMQNWQYRLPINYNWRRSDVQKNLGATFALKIIEINARKKQSRRATAGWVNILQWIYLEKNICVLWALLSLCPFFIGLLYQFFSPLIFFREVPGATQTFSIFQRIFNRQTFSLSMIEKSLVPIFIHGGNRVEYWLMLFFEIPESTIFSSAKCLIKNHQKKLKNVCVIFKRPINMFSDGLRRGGKCVGFGF